MLCSTCNRPETCTGLDGIRHEPRKGVNTTGYTCGICTQIFLSKKVSDIPGGNGNMDGESTLTRRRRKGAVYGKSKKA